jgi:hypothetical protein
MKNDLTTGAWQHNIGCPISITFLSTSDGITDMFRYKHHTIPIPVVTATDPILKATHQLTMAIEGV